MYKIAGEEELHGWVRNDTDGVHVVFNCEEYGSADRIANRIVKEAPKISIVQDCNCREITNQQFEKFVIAPSEADSPVKMLITPDLAICPSCSNELLILKDRRYQYPFITCTHCGPRFSIIKKLPYDRPYTTMDKFGMCNNCNDEYSDILDRRHYSQTNSCPDCPVSLFLYDRSGKLLLTDPTRIIDEINQLLLNGKILAVKGIGGYVLMVDAMHKDAIYTLRERKRRPVKPFAVMYPSLIAIEKDVYLNAGAVARLESSESPILLLPIKEKPESGVLFQEIAPGLDALGIMMPYTGLYRLIMARCQRPIIATSGNISDSPIIFRDHEALEDLTGIADYVLSNDRDIVVPQDDSVLRPSEVNDQFIVIRRSRGMAPSISKHPFGEWKNSVLAVGADLKSSFGIYYNGETYLSQYLGNLGYSGAQESYRHTLEHFGGLLKSKPRLIVSDLHPTYFSAQYAKEMASKTNGTHLQTRHRESSSDSWRPDTANIPHLQVQHHIAHFAANLGENDLIDSPEPVLGVIFDGTGYGLDKQIWGGEFFIYSKGSFERTGHLKYFEHKFGDKMAKEPRLSAFSLFYQFSEARTVLKSKFTHPEWKIYTKIGKGKLRTSSLGRVFDGIASMLGLCDVMSYEGEAAMYLEQSARTYLKANPGFADAYPFSIADDGTLDLDSCYKEICNEIINGMNAGKIACKFHFTICCIIEKYAVINNLRHIAFSGGVFQNAFLVKSCHRMISKEMTLYFHKELSPNDENIAFGQLVLAYMTDRKGSYLNEQLNKP